MLKVIDGLKLVDAANNTPDVKAADRTNATTNSTGVDMSEHEELLAILHLGVVDASHGMTFAIQESDEAAANFTNITTPVNTVLSIAAANSNTQRVLSVDWRHPDRKRYARVQGINDATNSALWAATTLRCRPKGGPVGVDDNVVEVTG